MTNIAVPETLLLCGVLLNHNLLFPWCPHVLLFQECLCQIFVTTANTELFGGHKSQILSMWEKVSIAFISEGLIIAPLSILVLIYFPILQGLGSI